MAEYETSLCVKNEVFVYQIPARTSNRGYRAADWKLDAPDWTGRLKVVSKGRELNIKLEDKSSGELFAICPVEAYPTPAVEQVLDSSRYFVIRIQDGNARHAFIGIGFADRGDSFDLLVALQDHFKQVKRDDKVQIEPSVAGSALTDVLDTTPKLDLSFKEGQTIKINIATKKSKEPESTKGKVKSKVGESPFRPPPPAGSKVPVNPVVPQRPANPMTVSPMHSVNRTSAESSLGSNAIGGEQPSSNVDLLLDLSSSIQSSSCPSKVQPATTGREYDELTGAVNTKLTIQANKSTAKKPESNSASWQTFD